MKNENAGIVYDRDVAQPEEKLKKKKKVKRSPQVLNDNTAEKNQNITDQQNSQMNNQNNNNTIDGRNNENVLSKNASNNNILSDYNSNNANDNNSNNNYASDKENNELNKKNSKDNNQSNKSNIEEDYNTNQAYKNNRKSNNLNNFQTYNTKSKADENSYYQDENNRKRNSEITNNKISNNNSILGKSVDMKCHQECEDMAKRISELEEIKEEYANHVCPSIEEYLRQIDELRRELEKKEKAVQSLTLTNKKQRNALESLSKQLDEKIDKVNFSTMSQNKNAFTQGNKTKQESNKSLEQELLMKEKELNNAMELIKILSRDKAQLKTSLDTYGEYQKKLQLLDLSKAKDNEIQSLTNELTLVKRQVEDHKQCLKNKSDQQVGNNLLKEDIKHLKKEIAQLRKKNNDLTSVQAGVANQNEIARAERSSEFADNNNPNSKNQLSKYKNRNRSMSPGPQENNRNNKHLSKDKMFLRTDIFHELFTQEEKEILKRLFNDNDKYDQFMKKIIILETAKASTEKKYKIIITQCMDKIAGLDEQIEYLNQKNKESESRLSIFQCQVNELKQSKKVYQKKITDFQTNTLQLETQLKEKKQEVNILTHQLNTFRNQKMELMKDVPDINDINQLRPSSGKYYEDEVDPQEGNSKQLVDYNEEKDDINREDY